MSTAVALDALDLAALLCSRVCHDLISPTGAIVNGLEVLDEKESDEETRNFALDLIRKSAKAASARLQFCRLAFGAAGTAGAMAQQVVPDDGKALWASPTGGKPENFRCVPPEGQLFLIVRPAAMLARRLPGRPRGRGGAVHQPAAAGVDRDAARVE